MRREEECREETQDGKERKKQRRAGKWANVQSDGVTRVRLPIHK